MPIKIGNKAVQKIMVGDKEVLKIIFGTNDGTGDIKYQKGPHFVHYSDWSNFIKNSSSPYTTYLNGSGNTIEDKIVNAINSTYNTNYTTINNLTLSYVKISSTAYGTVSRKVLYGYSGSSYRDEIYSGSFARGTSYTIIPDSVNPISIDKTQSELHIFFTNTSYSAQSSYNASIGLSFDIS